MRYTLAVRTNIALTLLLLFMTTVYSADNAVSRKIVVKTTSSFFKPNAPETPYTRQIIAFTTKNPDIEVQKWGGISVPGGGRASLMMAIAGKTAPDIGLSWFHLIRSEADQQFLLSA